MQQADRGLKEALFGGGPHGTPAGEAFTQKADRLIPAITALVDGLWLELCLSPGVLTAAEATAIVEEQIGRMLRLS